MADIAPFTPPAEEPDADDSEGRRGKSDGKKKDRYLGGSVLVEKPILIGDHPVPSFPIPAVRLTV